MSNEEKNYEALAKDISIFVCPTCDGTDEVVGDDGATPFCAECEDDEMYPLPDNIKEAVLRAADDVRTPVGGTSAP